MASILNKLLVEMVTIFVVAVAVGIAWNYSILYRSWTGSAPGGETGAPERSLPLPLGLMQVKSLYDGKGAIFVDARDVAAFAAGHIKGAVSLPVGDFAARLPRFIAQVKTTATLVSYCNGYDCHDSRELGTKLLLAGFRTVYLFEGGYPEWRDAGYPTVGGEK